MHNRASITIQHAAALLAAAGVALLLAACGGSSNNPSTNGGKSPSPASFAADAYKHAECMRRHGVPNFPNPQIVNTTTQHEIRQALPQSVGESPQFKTAQNACKGLLPEPHNGGPGEDAAEQRSHTKTFLALARCLRSHGVQGFPDPNAQGQLSLTTIRAAGVDLQAPSFLTAAKACVGVTHGAITLAQVEQAVHHAAGQTTQNAENEPAGGGSETESASPGPK
jgi:hypothetical protein